MKLSKSIVILLVLNVVWSLNGGGGGEAASIADQCANEFQKVTTCLTYATGKDDTPSKECCTSVTDIRAKDPVCLCYIIQQIHTGSNPQLKSMGIQEARLLQLPSACKLQNASSAECPKLLNLPPNSPDAAIFTNSSASATPATGTAAPAASGKASPSSNDKSNAFKAQSMVAAPLAIAMAVFFSAFLN